MNSLKESNTLRFSYILVTLAWISAMVGLVVLPLIAILTLTTDIEFFDYQLTFPINTEVILFTPENATNFMEISSAQASADMQFVAKNYPGAFTGVTLLAIIAFLMTFYAVHLLRKMLINLRKDQIFTIYNVQAIKRIAIVVLALSPMEWIYRIILTGPFASYLNENQVSINVGSADFGYITVGLLIYTLGLIFERGYQQHEELKLTV